MIWFNGDISVTKVHRKIVGDVCLRQGASEPLLLCPVIFLFYAFISFIDLGQM